MRIIRYWIRLIEPKMGCGPIEIWLCGLTIILIGTTDNGVNDEPKKINKWYFQYFIWFETITMIYMPHTSSNTNSTHGADWGEQKGIVDPEPSLLSPQSCFRFSLLWIFRFPAPASTDKTRRISRIFEYIYIYLNPRYSYVECSFLTLMVSTLARIFYVKHTHTHTSHIPASQPADADVVIALQWWR